MSDYVSTVVARGDKAINERYRPMRFSEVIGNENVKKGLTKWMEDGDKRAKALFLSGDSSCGKTTTSRIIAMGLNCEKGDTVEPCLECDNCRAAMSGNAFYIKELNMSSLNKKDDVEEIVDMMYQKTLSGRNMVFILDECQLVTNSAQNQLLKVVENPPKGLYIIFCTTEPNKIILPLRTRCSQYSFHLPTDSDIAKILGDVTRNEKIEMTSEQKIEFFNHVKGMSYRQILFALEQFRSGVTDINSLGTDPDVVNLGDLAFNIIYKGNFDKYVEVVGSGKNIEFEALRQTMRTMAGKEIEKAGLHDIDRATKYCEILDILDSRPFFDSKPQPTCSSSVFQICALVKSK